MGASGRRVGGFDVDVVRSVTHGRYVSIPRGELAKIIYQKIESLCEIIFDDSVTKIDQDKYRVSVCFKREPQRDFDMVIGADGLHSTIRKLVFRKDDRFEKYLGYMVAAFAVNGYRPRDEDVYVSYSLPGKHVARFAIVTTAQCSYSFSLIKAHNLTRRIRMPIRTPYGLNLAKPDGNAHGF